MSEHSDVADAREDYPELRAISDGYGCLIVEDAEEQCDRALDEIDRLRAIVAAAEWWYGTMGEEPTNTEAAEALRVAVARSHSTVVWNRGGESSQEISQTSAAARPTEEEAP